VITPVIRDVDRTEGNPMAKVTIKESGETAGIWVETASGQTVGLVADDRTGAYLCIYPENKAGVPLAISSGKTRADIGVQLPCFDADSERVTVKYVTIDQIAEALAAVAV
jgi:hypothetical protein